MNAEYAHRILQLGLRELFREIQEEEQPEAIRSVVDWWVSLLRFSP